MNSSELYDTFRSDVSDVAKPYLWSDDEVFRYMDAAYKMFVRLTGGITDFLSDATLIDIVAGEKVADSHPSILRVLHAERVSDGNPLRIVNTTDLNSVIQNDYGALRNLVNDRSIGTVHSMIIGRQKDKVEWASIPVEDDQAQLSVFRLPLEDICGFDHDLAEVDEMHHIYLLDWMKHLAYKKHDAETYDVNKSTHCGDEFRAYCLQAKGELERQRYKVGVVQYGG